MRLITTHLEADFDAFASAVVARRLYPEHQLVFPGSLSANVRRLLDEIPIGGEILRLRNVRDEEIEHLVVVDVATPKRLGELATLAESTPTVVIDHHDREPELWGEHAELIVRPVGATSTIICQLLRDQELEPSSEEASLLYLGIWEDTGGFSFRETTGEDLEAAAWLLGYDVSLAWVRRYLRHGMSRSGLDLLSRLAAEATLRDIHGRDVAIATLGLDHRPIEAASVVGNWSEAYDLDAAIAVLSVPPHVDIIIRSDIRGFDAGELARRFGGGGHHNAASARLREASLVEVGEKLVSAIDELMPPLETAGAIATKMLYSVPPQATVDQARDVLDRHQINAMPVQEPSGELIGTLTRRVLDAAQRHGLGGRPVHTIMAPEVPVLTDETPVDELRALFIERGHRFVVVRRANGELGLITRMEVLRRLFAHPRVGERLDNRMGTTRPVRWTLGRRLRRLLPTWAQALLDPIDRIARQRSETAWLVGGVVRDLLLGRRGQDIDLVIEGDGIGFAEALATELGARVNAYRPFLTAVVVLPGGNKIDVATARSEHYEAPAALPEVRTSLLRQDLYRRDFTVNALAMRLSGSERFELVDFFGGQKDLDRRTIRVLHSLSFIDDPTRAIRAVRFSRRLDFHLAAETEELIRAAAREGTFERISASRILRELDALVDERHLAASVSQLAELDLLPRLFGGAHWDESLDSLLLDFETQLGWFALEDLHPEPDLLIALITLLATEGRGDLQATCSSLEISPPRRRRINAAIEGAHALIVTARTGPASRIVRRVDEAGSEGLLVAMARLELKHRQALASAVLADRHLSHPVQGRELLAAGCNPGPHLGPALDTARDAMIDGATRQEALELALELARKQH